jgi:hypothetical protein
LSEIYLIHTTFRELALLPSSGDSCTDSLKLIKLKLTGFKLLHWSIGFL